MASEGLIEVATWTILLSIIAHGLTAGPAAAAYGRVVADATAEHHGPAPTSRHPFLEACLLAGVARWSGEPPEFER
jgi:hypothetical protein